MIQRNSIYKVILCVAVAFSILFLIYGYEVHRFTKDKWISNPDKRYLIVEDLLSKYTLVGMSEGDVIKLLGEETNGSKQTSFKGDRTYYVPEETLVYYIGTDFLEGRWLILSLKNQEVVSVSFGVT